MPPSPEEFIATLQHRLAITKRSLAEAQQTIDTLAGALQAERDAGLAAAGPIPDDVCDPLSSRSRSRIASTIRTLLAEVERLTLTASEHRAGWLIERMESEGIVSALGDDGHRVVQE